MATKSTKTTSRRAASAGAVKALGKNLVIVESPAKAKTITRYLGDSYVVAASMGHVRDLPSEEMGVDLEHDFTPSYDVIEGRKKIVDQLRRSRQVRRRSVSWRPTWTARARPSPGTWPRRSTCRRTAFAAWCSTRSPSRPSGKPSSHPRGIDSTRSTPSRLGGSSTASSATRSVPSVAEGGHGPLGRAGAERGRAADRRSRAGDRRVHAGGVLAHRGRLHHRPGRRARTGRGSGRSSSPSWTTRPTPPPPRRSRNGWPSAAASAPSWSSWQGQQGRADQRRFRPRRSPRPSAWPSTRSSAPRTPPAKAPRGTSSR